MRNGQLVQINIPLKQEGEEIYQEIQQIVKPRILNPEIIITESFSL